MNEPGPSYLTGVEGAVRNEAFCMELATRSGLPVPRSWTCPALDPRPLPPGRAGDGSARDGDLEREVRLERGTVVVPVPPPERHSRSSRPCHTRAMTTQSGSIR